MGTVLSRNVKVTNQADKPLYVEVVEAGAAGQIMNVYQESLSVAGLATVTILTYTVPVGKTMNFNRVDFSGGNRSIYTLEINSSVQSKKRMYFTRYNGEFIMGNLKLVEGDIIKIIVENKTNMTADFNANLLGSLNDA